jgi:hypothetical protein
MATMTWARTAVEERVLRSSIAELLRHGLPLAIADTARSESFRRYIAELESSTVRVASRHGLVAQVQASVELAASFDRPYILYTEPDKEAFFSRSLADFVDRAPAGDEIGIVLAARSSAALRTFPPTQRYVEGVVNHLCSDLLGAPGDYCYGPFLMHRSLVAAMAGLTPALGWGWRTWLFRAARRNGLCLHHVVGDHDCPVEQRAEHDEERAHRLRQLSENVAGLVA